MAGIFRGIGRDVSDIITHPKRTGSDILKGGGGDNVLTQIANGFNYMGSEMDRKFDGLGSRFSQGFDMMGGQIYDLTQATKNIPKEIDRKLEKLSNIPHQITESFGSFSHSIDAMGEQISRVPKEISEGFSHFNKEFNSVQEQISKIPKKIEESEKNIEKFAERSFNQSIKMADQIQKEFRKDTLQVLNKAEEIEREIVKETREIAETIEKDIEDVGMSVIKEMKKGFDSILKRLFPTQSILLYGAIGLGLYLLLTDNPEQGNSNPQILNNPKESVEAEIAVRQVKQKMKDVIKKKEPLPKKIKEVKKVLNKPSKSMKEVIVKEKIKNKIEEGIIQTKNKPIPVKEKVITKKIQEITGNPITLESKKEKISTPNKPKKKTILTPKTQELKIKKLEREEKDLHKKKIKEALEALTTKMTAKELHQMLIDVIKDDLTSLKDLSKIMITVAKKNIKLKKEDVAEIKNRIKDAFQRQVDGHIKGTQVGLFIGSKLVTLL
jgi:predicted PurR-regulated permease PerM